MSFRRLVILVSLLSLVGTSGQARPRTTPTPAASVTESVQVNVVNVDVLVTDRGGKPVTGLTAADFVLFEDGKPVQITNFYSTETRRPGPAADATAAGGAAPSAVPADDEQVLHLVVVIDGLNLDMAGAQLALEALANVIETHLRPGDDVMIASFQRALRIDQPLSEDLQAAAAKLRELKRLGPQSGLIRMAQAGIFNRMSSGTGMSDRANEVATAGLLMDIEAAAEEEKALQTLLLESTGRLVDSLAGLQGRKALILVSNGIPREVGAGLFREFEARYPNLISPITNQGRYGMVRYFNELGARANAGRVTFYPISAQAFRGLDGMDPSMREIEAAPGGRALAAGEMELSLFSVAAATGGKVLPNSGLLEEKLVETVENVDASYSLGYSPAHVGDGRYHRFKVEVKREGVKVRHREGYLDKPAEERVADRTAAALLRAGRTNPLGLQASTSPAVHQHGKVFRVPLTVTLPGSVVTLLPSRKGLEGKVSVLVAGRDSLGRQAEVHRETFPIPVPEERVEELKRENLVFTFDVLVRQGQSTLAVTARDEHGGGESTVTLVVEALPKT